MATQLFNIARGRIVQYYDNVKSNSPAASGFIVVLLTANEADDTLNNYDDLATLLAAAGNTEATHTNYARKVITDAELAALPAPDDTNNRLDLDLPDQTFTSLGAGAATTKAVICYAPDTAGADGTLIPITHHDAVGTPDGTDFVVQINAAGFYRSA
jgi:hypothetical protein